jgi:hypothetical protein
MVDMMSSKTLATMTLALLAMSIFTCGSIQEAPLKVAYGSAGGNIDTNAEYSNGTLGTDISGLTLWYTWVNTSGSQIIFLAYQSAVLNPPVITFLGQHYYANDGTEVFVGNTLEAMELYNDTNGNGLPDANYTSGQSEIMYHFLVNSSESFDIRPINKTFIQGLPHYEWGIRYNTIDGFLNSANDQSTDAMVMVDYMDFSYDFYVQNNVTYLKTNFGLGKITHIVPTGYGNVSLDGLSIALFYGTIVITSEPYVTMVNGNPYNSTTAPASVEPASSSEIKIAEAVAYKFLFGQDYTLFADSKQEIHESKCTAVSNQSVSVGVKRGEWILTLLEDTLSSVFPKISSTKAAINLDYNVSSFLYRVCYPVWSGHQLQHDPTYIAYLGIPIVSELSLPIMFVVVAAVASIVALVAAVIDLKKTRRTLKLSNPTGPLKSCARYQSTEPLECFHRNFVACVFGVFAVGSVWIACLRYCVLCCCLVVRMSFMQLRRGHVASSGLATDRKHTIPLFLERISRLLCILFFCK